MTEDGGRHDHASVIAAAKDLDVGPAGKRGAHTNEDIARSESGNRYPFELYVLFSVEYGREHRYLSLNSCGRTMIFERIFVRKLAWVRRQAKCKLDLIKRDAV